MTDLDNTSEAPPMFVRNGEEKTLKDFLPQRLRENYNAIRKTNDVMINGDNVDGSIAEIEHLINDAQPKDLNEEIMRTMVQYLYRRDPNEFYKFLIKSKLFHLVLWTESKKMSRHFRLNNIVYIRWNGIKYECYKHSNYDVDTQKKRVFRFNSVKNILPNFEQKMNSDECASYDRA